MIKAETNNSTIQNSQPKLPEGWKWVRLGEVCEIVKGRKPELYDVKGKNFLPYLTAETLRYGVSPKWCDPNDRNSVKVDGNEVILIADGSYSGDVFLGFEGILASTMGKLKIKENVVSDYLFWFIKFNFNILNSTKRGGAIPHLEKQIFYELEIPLPSIDEQRRIVTKLQDLMQDVERARNACEKQLEAVKALPSAYLREVFESDEAKKWERRRLGEVCEIVKGRKPELYDVKKNNFLPYLTAETLRYGISPKWCDPDDKNSVKVEANEIILIADGSYSGDVFLGFEGILASTMGKLKIKGNTVSDYLFWFIKFNFNILNSTKRGGAIPHLEKQIFYELGIPLPSIEDQHRIASELKEKMAYVERLRKSIEEQLEAINALPQAILRKAFRGEL